MLCMLGAGRGDSEEPEFALGSAMSALRWLCEEWGYKVTSVDVLEAYDRAMDAAARLDNQTGQY